MYIESHFGAYIVKARANSRESQLVQTDWDFPATASCFRWSTARVQRDPKTGAVRTLARLPRDYKVRAERGYCEHSGTDGTVDCAECGVTAGEFIESAANCLDSKC